MTLMRTDWRAELRSVVADETHPEHQLVANLCRDVAAHLPEMLAWCNVWTDADAESKEWSRLVCTLPPGDAPAISTLGMMVLGIKQGGVMAGASTGGKKGGAKRKLDPVAIAKAVDLYLEGNLPQKTVARRYGMGRTTLQAAINERTKLIAKGG